MPAQQHPHLRVIPTPDERREPATRVRTNPPPPVAGALALQWEARPGPAPRRHLHVVRPGEVATARPGPVPAARLHTLVQAIAESLAGLRHLEQLRTLGTREVLNTVRRCRRRFRSCGAPYVHRIRTDAPLPGTLEVSAVVRYGDRHRALALRLDHTAGHWLCTALRVG